MRSKPRLNSLLQLTGLNLRYPALHVCGLSASGLEMMDKQESLGRL